MYGLLNYRSSRVRRQPAGLRRQFEELRSHLERWVPGQETLIDRLLLALLADGHLLVEGISDADRRIAVEELSAAIEGEQRGELAGGVLRAEEIERSPARLQNQLLEIVAGRQPAGTRSTYERPEPFLVVAAAEAAKPEAQLSPQRRLDSFAMHVRGNGLATRSGRGHLRLVRDRGAVGAPPVRLSRHAIHEARRRVMETSVSPALEYYLVQLVVATSYPHLYDSTLKGVVREGAGQRGAVALDRCARAHAWMHGRDGVQPDDIHAVARDVLRHRVRLTEAALAGGITPDSYLERLLAALPPI